MALSNAPEVKRAFYDALVTALPDVAVWYGAPNVDHNPHENVIIGREDQPMTVSQNWETIGADAQRSESIDIPVRVDVFLEGTDAFAADDRMWAIAQVVADVLAANPFDPYVIESHPDDFEQATQIFADGRLARVDFTVHCESRVSGI